VLDRVQELVETVRAECALDTRVAVFEVRAELDDGCVTLAGETTESAAVDELARRAGAVPGIAVRDRVVRLPGPAFVGAPHALVRSAIAPVHTRPDISSTQVSQLVRGRPAELLSALGPWRRVRAEDGYIGWVHHGFLEPATEERWTGAAAAAQYTSLGAELADRAGRTSARAPWGARLLGAPDGYLLPDGRTGVLTAGEIVATAELADRFPPTGDRIVESTHRWLGTPYLWGGVTQAGADCSGLVQAVFRLHGIALARDSDMQARAGSEVRAGSDFGELRPGDLLFFAERQGRISHVAISLGGPGIIHSALSNGGVAVNDLLGDRPTEVELRRILTCVRRVG
jgi:gamma-D-glutamyl-L-lysine dipeptidyl-peptidase